MIKKLLTKLALWILDGQYVPVEWWEKARKERDDEMLDAAKRYDDSVQYLQRQSSEYLVRALRAEASIAELSRNYTENVQNPQMIDIRVPKKVRK
jgi:hypothetical protein